jgi:hypothetical protein
MSIEEYNRLEEIKRNIAELIKKGDASKRAFVLLTDEDLDLIAKVIMGLHIELDGMTDPRDRERYITNYFILAIAAQQASFKTTLQRLIEG